jgi:hypothetical protein
MNYATAWFLVMVSSGHYIGPLPQAACQAAAVSLRGESVVCRQADRMMVCAVDGRPGAYTACPAFDFPAVTVKP